MRPSHNYPVAPPPPPPSYMGYINPYQSYISRVCGIVDPYGPPPPSIPQNEYYMQSRTIGSYGPPNRVFSEYPPTSSSPSNNGNYGIYGSSGGFYPPPYEYYGHYPSPPPPPSYNGYSTPVFFPHFFLFFSFLAHILEATHVILLPIRHLFYTFYILIINLFFLTSFAINLQYFRHPTLLHYLLLKTYLI